MRVVVYGATGLTGGLVVRELVARGIEVVLAGRDRDRLRKRVAKLEHESDRRFESRVAAVHDRGALATTMRDAALVISCAGPFALMGDPVVRAAIDAGADYLDSSGEQQFILQTYQRYESAARKSGVCVVSACAFEVALGDWAATLAARELPGELDEMTIGYAIDRFHPSAGTRMSTIDSLSAPSLLWVTDRWEEVAPASERRTISYPELGQRPAVSFPSGEVITVPRHLDVHRVSTFLSLGGDTPLGRLGARLTGVLAPALPFLARSPLASGVRARSFGHHPTEVERQSARFSIVAHARQRFEDARVGVVGTNVYGTTAAILANCAEQLLARRDQPERPVGVLAPSQAFDPQTSLASLAAQGCTVVR